MCHISSLLYSSKPIRLCRAGEYQSTAPSASSDRVCSNCQDGVTFQSADNHTLTSCSIVSAVCSPGGYQQASPSLTADRKCIACGPGTFQDKSGQTSCVNVLLCAAGQYQSAAPTLTSDRKCASCDGITGYQDLVNQTAWYESR